MPYVKKEYNVLTTILGRMANRGCRACTSKPMCDFLPIDERPDKRIRGCFMISCLEAVKIYDTEPDSLPR